MTTRPFSMWRMARRRNVRLGDLAHGDGALDTGFDAGLFQEVLEGEAVHDRAEHAHVVGAGTVHAALGQFGAAEEVPPPTTIATSTSGTAAAICLATPRTVSGSTPSFPPPKTSPIASTGLGAGSSLAGLK